MTRASNKRPEQLYIDGTAPPKNPIIDESCDRWLDAVDAKKASAEDAKLCHQVLLARLKEAGIKAHPYIERSTGAKRVIKIKPGDDKLVTAKEPKLKREDRPDREKDMAGLGSAEDRAKAGYVATVVGGHAAPRVAGDDPFGATRGLLDEARARQGADDGGDGTS